MKKIAFYLIMFFVCRNSFANFIYKPIYRDSTIKDRFVVSLLNDTDKNGRWIYVMIYDSCDNRGSFKIVSVSNLFKVYEHDYEIDVKKNFIISASINILQYNSFSNCHHSNNPIVGIDVNFDIVSQLVYLSDEELLNTYFDENKYLRESQKRLLNEVIAACFLKNIKVITENPNKIYYEIFK